MAEAARTTKHYVSDCLQDRYPYDAQKGFVGIREREVGRVFDGFGSSGMDDMIQSLTDPLVPTEERTRAVHHLYARSASQEVKMELLHKGMVPLLIATLQQHTDFLLTHQCLILLRSLAVLPQGCFAIVRGGALPVTLAALEPMMTGDTFTQAAQACCVAAAHVLYQLSANMSGLRWLLGVEHAPIFELADVVPAGRPMKPELIVQHVVDGIARSETPSEATLYLTQTLARLTSLERGVRAFLDSRDAVAVLVAQLKRLPSPPKQEVELCEATLELMWNTGLSHVGSTSLAEHGVPDTLFTIFASTSSCTEEVPLSVQRQLTGALSVVLQLTAVKQSSTEPVTLDDNRPRVTALIDYLRGWNRRMAAQYTEASRSVPRDIAAVLTNVVQCVRLASEVKAVRDITHAVVDAVETEATTEAFYLRRQLYYNTRWEKEYDASVDV